MKISICLLGSAWATSLRQIEPVSSTLSINEVSTVQVSGVSDAEAFLALFGSLSGLAGIAVPTNFREAMATLTELFAERNSLLMRQEGNQGTEKEDLNTQIVSLQQDVMRISVESRECKKSLASLESSHLLERQTLREKLNGSAELQSTLLTCQSRLSISEQQLSSLSLSLQSAKMDSQTISDQLRALQTELTSLRLAQTQASDLNRLSKDVFELRTKLSACSYDLEKAKRQASDKVSDRAGQDKVNRLVSNMAKISSELQNCLRGSGQGLKVTALIGNSPKFDF